MKCSACDQETELPHKMESTVYKYACDLCDTCFEKFEKFLKKYWIKKK